MTTLPTSVKALVSAGMGGNELAQYRMHFSEKNDDDASHYDFICVIYFLQLEVTLMEKIDR